MWILHLIDAGKRYTAYCWIRRKKKELVVCHIFQIRVAYFRAPGKFHNDCGREFANHALGEMNEKKSTETSTIPGESPFHNGVEQQSFV